MAKLHIYRKVLTTWNKQADGDGDLSSSEDFNVALTSGSVSQGHAYQIRKGQSVVGEIYNCLTGAQKGDTATFHIAAASRDVVLAPEASPRAARGFRAAFLAAQKTVSIEIDSNQLETLKGSSYRLCFAKKVGNEAYNIVWQSYFDYLVSNTFSWTPTYQLFGSNTFAANLTVKVATNLVPIGLGEQSTLDAAGVLSAASTGGPETSINMINNFGTIHPGVNQLSTGIDGKQVSTPIYVATMPIVSGNAYLTPVEKVLVWFEQNIETSTMFSDSRSQAVEIDLTMTNSATRLYKDQHWSTPS